MLLSSLTGSPIVLAGLTIPVAEDSVHISANQYLADEDRRAQINALYAEGALGVSEEDELADGTDGTARGLVNHESFYWLPGQQFPTLTTGETEAVSAAGVAPGTKFYGKIVIPGVLTVADSVDSLVVPFNSKITGLAAHLGTDNTGAACILSLKKNGTEVFAGHTADRLTLADGNTGSSATGPAFGEAAYNAANQAALLCEVGDVLTVEVVQIGTTSGHHGSDLSMTVVLEAAAHEAGTSD